MFLFYLESQFLSTCGGSGEREMMRYGGGGSLILHRLARWVHSGGEKWGRCFGPRASEEGTTSHVLITFIRNARPESGLDCLTCSMFARRWLGFNALTRRRRGALCLQNSFFITSLGRLFQCGGNSPDESGLLRWGGSCVASLHVCFSRWVRTWVSMRRNSATTTRPPARTASPDGAAPAPGGAVSRREYT